MSISNDGLHLAYSLGNSIVKRRKSWLTKTTAKIKEEEI